MPDSVGSRCLWRKVSERSPWRGLYTEGIRSSSWIFGCLERGPDRGRIEGIGYVPTRVGRIEHIGGSSHPQSAYSIIPHRTEGTSTAVVASDSFPSDETSQTGILDAHKYAEFGATSSDECRTVPLNAGAIFEPTVRIWRMSKGQVLIRVMVEMVKSDPVIQLPL